MALSEKMLSFINGRKVLIWGAYEKNDAAAKDFEAAGIALEGFIDRSDKVREYKGYPVYSTAIVDRKLYYVYIGLSYEHISAYHYMLNKNYIEFEDFWFPERPIEIDTTCNYSDLYGNSFTTEPFVHYNISVMLSGGSRITVGRDCKINKTCKIRAFFRSEIVLEKNVSLGEDSEIWAVSNSKAVIGGSTGIGTDTVIYSGNYGQVKLGRRCVNNRHCMISSQMNTQVVIGDDSLISHYVIIRASNGHNIFDLKKGVNLDANDKRDVIIGKHVWLGIRSVILSGAAKAAEVLWGQMPL